MARYLLFLLLSLLSVNVYANIIVTVDKTEGGAADATYSFTIHGWGEVALPNPCYGNNSCSVMINHRHKEDNTGGDAHSAWWGGCVSTSRSVTELGECLASTEPKFKAGSGGKLITPFISQTRHLGPVVVKECVGMFWALNYATRGGGLLPGSVCAEAPPPLVKCDFINNIEIEHGQVSSSELDGHNANQTLNISCTSDAQSTIYLVGGSDGRLVLDENSKKLYSQLTLNGIVMRGEGVPLHLNKGLNDINVGSRIMYLGNLESGGQFSASGILVLSLH